MEENNEIGIQEYLATSRQYGNALLTVRHREDPLNDVDAFADLSRQDGVSRNGRSVLPA